MRVESVYVFMSWCITAGLCLLWLVAAVVLSLLFA